MLRIPFIYEGAVPCMRILITQNKVSFWSLLSATMSWFHPFPLRVSARILKWNAIFHENKVSNSYPSNSKIPNLRMSKIIMGCPKDRWTDILTNTPLYPLFESNCPDTAWGYHVGCHQLWILDRFNVTSLREVKPSFLLNIEWS